MSTKRSHMLKPAAESVMPLFSIFKKGMGRVLNMTRYNYNNIVTNVTIVEFLSARIVHPGPPQLTILYFLTLVKT